MSFSPKNTAHSHFSRHVITCLGPLFWVAFPALGLSRLRGVISLSAAARTGTSIFPECPVHSHKLAKSRDTPTPAEVDRAEQSLIRIRTDLASKREELTLLKRREASQTEVAHSECYCDACPNTPFQGAQKSSWLSRVTPSFRGDNGSSWSRHISLLA